MTATGDHSFQELRPVQALRTPSFELKDVRGHGDLVDDHDRRLAELAREAEKARPSGTPQLLAVPVSTLTEITLHLGDEGEDLLEDARANVGNGDYPTALELLQEYLDLAPEHQEARYLRAFCLFHLDGDKRVQALRILRPLRDEPLPDDLRERVRELRGELRRLLTPAEITAYAGAADSDPEGALERVAAFLELAPEEGTLSYLLALGQARAGQLEEALDTAERGAEEADTDRERVAAYARRLKLALLHPHAAPALSAFRTGELRRAREELAAMDPHWRRTRVLDDFDDHLRHLLQGTLPSRGSDLPEERAEDLYTLVAESDAQQAAALMGMGRLEEAERFMAHLLSLVPGFRWLNFLYAACLLRLGQDPDRAVDCAETALRDPTITQAPELLEAVRDWQEAVAVNPVIDAYVNTMESVRDGVSAADLDTLRARLNGLRLRIPELRGTVRSEVGKQVVRQLDEAVAARLAELEQVERSMAVSALVQSFNELPNRVGRTDRHRMRAELGAILQDARRLRRESGLPPEARHTLDQMIELISRTLA
ncbi:tetratricopeptide repeat protein [Streptomyces sp. NPDC005483]|uniref:tetratricopeptide repeat protein n=1 Tax=Streptomyces sp. NPDC005483 TaxID=3154882 RepID=UPI0033BBD664